MLGPGYSRSTQKTLEIPWSEEGSKGSHGKNSHQNTWSLVTCSCSSVHFFPKSDDTYSCRADKRDRALAGRSEKQ